MKLIWYFDFISPFAYLQHCQFDKLPSNLRIEYKPVLLAGLLKHWQNVGPAEIPPKRIFTYKHCYWMANNKRIDFKMPPAHPFNSLLALRLAIATGNKKDKIQTIFEVIWRLGLAIDSSAAKEFLATALGLENLEDVVLEQWVKDKLRSNTEAAAAHSVFGVPTFVVEHGAGSQLGNEIFWGLDAFDMLLDYCSNPQGFGDDEYARIEQLPLGAQRQR